MGQKIQFTKKINYIKPKDLISLPEGRAAYKFFRAAKEHVEIVLCFEFVRDWSISTAPRIGLEL